MIAISRRSWFYQGNRVSHEEDTRIIVAGQVSENDKKKTNEIRTSKYNFFTFLPQNLIEQFRRIANFYFLIVAIISFVIDSPVPTATSVLPLFFVISVTMVKQGYEDWLRHRTDNSVNNESVTVIRNLIAQEVRCREIRPGELVKVNKESDIPCDMVLLWSSDSRGKCFVNTANLDGETSLKPLRVPLPLVKTKLDKTFESKISLEVLKPEHDIYTFFGRLNLGKDVVTSIGIENLLLRGSRLKNTEWIIGCAIYTGRDTKLALNSKMTSNKFTSCEAYINKFLIFYLILMVLQILISYLIKRFLDSFLSDIHEYLGPLKNENNFYAIMQDIFSFLILYNYIVPISLYVTIELQKFIGAMYLGWDNELKCAETNQRAVFNSSDLNEELGQIEILFSDKTGTLTKNDMHFKMCSVKGELYIEKNRKLYEMTENWLRGDTIEAIEEMNPDLQMFFTVLALCHTVQVEETPKMMSNGTIRMSRLSNLSNLNNNVNFEIPQYQATSCDEIAFVNSAAYRGIIFCGEDFQKLVIRLPLEVLTYEKLQVLEFTSARKRMSIIVKDINGKIWLFCKGAENSVLPLCKDSHLIDTTNQQVNFFASQGLRTLVVAYKELTQAEFDKINNELSNSNLSLDNIQSSKEDGLNKWRDYEDGLTLLGATAVEDLLQDDVADTLIALRDAGIKIWVLTGDKIETAINVAQSCGHIPENAFKLFLVDIQTSEAMDEQMEICRNTVHDKNDNNLTLVVDGSSLALILGKKELETQFAEMSMRCEAVICCRLSPLQKSQIVAIIKRSEEKPITAAIGDGANDISMIQEAHVGFGLFGKEGRQAARSADFAFAKFMMVKKILLVHGHWFYQRLATLVQYFFYKNLVFVNLIIFFQIHSNFSTQSELSTVFLTSYNLFYTAVPVLVLSITEQCHSKEMLMNVPSLYKRQVRNRFLSWKNFFGWFLLGLYHSAVIFYFWYAVFEISSVIFTDGKSSDLWTLGSAISHSLIIGINLKLLFMARYQTYALIASVILTILFFMGLTVFFSEVYTKSFESSIQSFGVYSKLLASPNFWFMSTLVLVTMFFVDYTYFNVKGLFFKKRSRRVLPTRMVEMTHF